MYTYPDEFFGLCCSLLFLVGLLLGFFLSHKIHKRDTHIKAVYVCLCSAHLMSFLCLLSVFSVCRFGLLLFILFCFDLLFVLSSFSVCLCSSKREKNIHRRDLRCPSCHTRPRLLPNTPEWLYAVIYICGSMSVSKICFFFFSCHVCLILWNVLFYIATTRNSPVCDM